MATQRDASGVLQNAIPNPRFVQRAATIRAKIGVTFGFQFKVTGVPDGAWVTLRIVTRYPRPGATPPGAAHPLRITEQSLRRKLDRSHRSWLYAAGTLGADPGKMGDRGLERRPQARRAGIHARSQIKHGAFQVRIVCPRSRRDLRRLSPGGIGSRSRMPRLGSLKTHAKTAPRSYQLHRRVRRLLRARRAARSPTRANEWSAVARQDLPSGSNLREAHSNTKAR